MTSEVSGYAKRPESSACRRASVSGRTPARVHALARDRDQYVAIDLRLHSQSPTATASARSSGWSSAHDLVLFRASDRSPSASPASSPTLPTQLPCSTRAAMPRAKSTSLQMRRGPSAPPAALRVATPGASATLSANLSRLPPWATLRPRNHATHCVEAPRCAFLRCVPRDALCCASRPSALPSRSTRLEACERRTVTRRAAR